MKDKYSDHEEFSLDEESGGAKANSSLRQDNELFDDEMYVPQPLISVKRHVFSSSKEEDWEVYNNKSCVLTLKGTRFSKKEREFLRTPKGFNFIVEGYKQGWKAISEFKRQIKKVMV